MHPRHLSTLLWLGLCGLLTRCSASNPTPTPGLAGGRLPRAGLVGGPPKPAWLIDYPMFERIHYLLVAGFDVYGNLGHQLVTRHYMDFLRREGEFNFPALLPPAERLRLRDYWYRGASDAVKAYLYGPQTQLHHAPAISYHSDQPQQELYQLLQQRVAPHNPMTEWSPCGV